MDCLIQIQACFLMWIVHGRYCYLLCNLEYTLNYSCWLSITISNYNLSTSALFSWPFLLLAIEMRCSDLLSRQFLFTGIDMLRKQVLGIIKCFNIIRSSIFLYSYCVLYYSLDHMFVLQEYSVSIA